VLAIRVVRRLTQRQDAKAAAVAARIEAAGATAGPGEGAS
jgi:hypothetical protein